MSFYLCIGRHNNIAADLSTIIAVISYIETYETAVPKIFDFKKGMTVVIAQATSNEATIMLLKGIRLFDIPDKHILTGGPLIARNSLHVSLGTYTQIFEYVYSNS